MKTETMHVALHGGPVGHSCNLTVDGVDISHHVQACTIRAAVGEAVTVELQLVNVDIDTDGDAVVGAVIIPVVPPDEEKP
jgi:hypothetical protein